MNVIIIKYQFIFNFVACNLFVNAQINIKYQSYCLYWMYRGKKQHLKYPQIGLFIFGNICKKAAIAAYKKWKEQQQQKSNIKYLLWYMILITNLVNVAILSLILWQFHNLSQDKSIEHIKSRIIIEHKGYLWTLSNRCYTALLLISLYTLLFLISYFSYWINNNCLK